MTIEQQNVISPEKAMNNDLRAKVQALGTEGPYMTPAHIAVFREHLVSLGQLLTRKYHDVRLLIKDCRQDSADAVDAAQGVTDLDGHHQREFAITQHQKAIQNALESIRNDEYGYCIDCGEKIGYARMLSMPWSIRDAECARIHELKMAQQTGGRIAA